MKTMIIAAAILVSSIGHAFAYEGETVDSKIAKKFNTTFKAAKGVIWTVTDDYSIASFGLEGTRMETYYDKDGELIGTFRNVTSDQLPAKALAAAENKYKGYVLTEAVYEAQPYNNHAYYVTLVGPDKKVILQLHEKGWYKNVNTIY
jgi:hypothetical protein